MNVSKINLGRNVQSISLGDSIAAVSQVVINYGVDSDGKTLTVQYPSTAGSGRVLEIAISTITDGITMLPAIAQSIYQKFQSDRYTPATITGAELDPAAELGDGVLCNGTYTVIGNLETNFNQGMWADIEAQGITDDEDIFYVEGTQREIERNYAKQTASISVKADRVDIVGMVTFTDLSTSGESVINGDNITTGAIYSDDYSEGTTVIPEWGSGTYYAVGDYCETNTGVYYRCNTAHTSGVSFESQYWTSISTPPTSYPFTGSGTLLDIDGDSIHTPFFAVAQSGTVFLKNAIRVLTTGQNYGSIGQYQGSSGSAATYGVMMAGDKTKTAYVCATDTTVKMQGGSDYLYIVNGAIEASRAVHSSSDRRLKQNISYDLAAYEAFYNKLKPAIFAYRADDVDKLHTGFIAQDVKQAMDDAGLNAADFCGWGEAPVQGDEDAMQGLVYADFVALNTMMIQKLLQRVAALEEEVRTLKGEE